MAGAIAPATALRRDQDRPGAQSPRPAPAPPLAGASRPPGRALASVCPGPAGLQGTVARGRGKRGSRFLSPPKQAKALSTLQWQGPAPLPQRYAAPCPAGGPKPPASARPAPGGRWPALFPDMPVCVLPFRTGGGNALRFLIPPGQAKALSPLPWQGPSPLPQRHAEPRPAGGPKPPASARPAPGGRFAPAGSGTGLCLSRTCRSTAHRSARAGETRCVS